MLPYFPQPSWTIGGITIRAFGVCAAGGLVAGHWLLMRRARIAALDTREAALYYIFLLLGGIGGAMYSAVSGAAAFRSGDIIAGGIAGALVCYLARPYARKHVSAYLDVTGFTAPFVAIAVRLGCTFAHDHRGAASRGWLAFNFPEGPRYDLGFMELLFALGCSGLFLWLDRVKRRPLLFMALGITFYAVFRLYRRGLEP